jgi:hypothetical protein
VRQKTGPAKHQAYTTQQSKNLFKVRLKGLCEVSDQVQDKISNQMFKNEFKNNPRVFK